jgi:hypothetical protein
MPFWHGAQPPVRPANFEYRIEPPRLNHPGGNNAR